METLSSQQEEYCKNVTKRLKSAQIGHFIAYENFHRGGRWLGALAALLTALTSMLILFYNGNAEASKYNYLVIITSVLATVTASLQPYLNLEDRARRHKDSAHKYGMLKRKVENFRAVNQEDFGAFVKSTNQTWDHIAETAPVTPKRHRSKMGKQLDHKDKSGI